ncbi:YceD family protein [Algoriphagus hitonicola]|uniref:Uncharacterized metal-binding protein YceD, DUF177 family n=1 Tax=Algoriphagus hitonicola TaxID=435880 RepID=A0A1I2WTW2_9BACT|nr:DUF177 domain-containing protein [Algoriphagus hitonicola]SFH04753.1 Uncharacterized metal-binding protein YceD, DUF177 family [Algoriphagus hitonicola]
MKFLRGFDIEVIKFTEGIHEIDFQIDDAFLGQFEENELAQKGKLTARVKMNKGANLIEMQFHIEGTIRLTCDRSLEEFDFPLEVDEEIIFKYGPEEKEIDENIIMITRDTPKVNVAQLIYEFILLAIPAKKIHPDYQNELDEYEDAEGIYIYIDSEDSEKEEDKTENNDPVDPRWEKLKNLKKNE